MPSLRRPNLSGLIKINKDLMGVRDIPTPCTDEDLMQHIIETALYDFSVLSPFVKTVLISEEERIGDSEGYMTGHVYRIPKHYYVDALLLGVTRVDISRPNGFSDMYMPQSYSAAPDQILMAIADIQTAAAVARSMGRAPTFKFEKPDLLYIYNGWTRGVYEIDLKLSHDLSLTTIEDAEFIDFKKLVRYSMESYYYSLLKRKDHIDTGVGSIDLKIDEWQDSQNKYDELIEKWQEEGANMPFDQMRYF